MNRKGITCIIDDDEIFIYGIKKLIEIRKLCDNLLFFRNGADALTYISSIENSPELFPDLILLDINMPVMNGWEFISSLCNNVKTPEKEIIISIISSSIDPRDEERAKQIPEIKNYLTKPVSLDGLAGLFAC